MNLVSVSLHMETVNNSVNITLTQHEDHRDAFTIRKDKV